MFEDFNDILGQDDLDEPDFNDVEYKKWRLNYIDYDLLDYATEDKVKRQILDEMKEEIEKRIEIEYPKMVTKRLKLNQILWDEQVKEFEDKNEKDFEKKEEK